MKRILTYAGILIVLSSCGAGWHLKRARFHELKAESLGANVNQDTVFITKEVIVPQIEIDTVLSEVNFRDTIVVTKDNVVTKIKINDILRTVYVNTICPPDTLKIEVPFTVTKEISAGYTTWQLIGYVAGFSLFFIVVSFLVGWMVRNRR